MFHLANPGLTTTNNSKRKPKLTSKQLKAKQEHEAWLKKQNVHPTQLAERASKSKRLAKTVKADSSTPPCTNGFALGGARRSVFDSEWQRTYEDDEDMARRERAALVLAEEKKSRILPLYNKGPAMFASENEDMSKVGSLSKR